MSDYRTENRINGDSMPLQDEAILDDLGDTFAPESRTNATMDRIEALAARKVGTAKARQYREQADVALERGQILARQGRDLLDDQLAIAPYRTVAVAALVGLLAGHFLTPRKKKIVYVRKPSARARVR